MAAICSAFEKDTFNCTHRIPRRVICTARIATNMQEGKTQIDPNALAFLHHYYVVLWQILCEGSINTFELSAPKQLGQIIIMVVEFDCDRKNGARWNNRSCCSCLWHKHTWAIITSNRISHTKCCRFCQNTTTRSSTIDDRSHLHTIAINHIKINDFRSGSPEHIPSFRHIAAHVCVKISNCPH